MSNEKIPAAHQAMCTVQKTIHLEKEMGKELGRGEVL